MMSVVKKNYDTFPQSSEVNSKKFGKKLKKFSQKVAHNFVSFDFFGNLLRLPSVSRRDASIGVCQNFKNPYGLAVRNEKLPEKGLKTTFLESTLSVKFGLKFTL